MTINLFEDTPEARQRIDELIEEGLASGFGEPDRPISEIIREAKRHAFEAMFKKQKGRCAICGEAMPAKRWDCAHATIWKKRRPTLDHIRPRSKGGSDDASNLQLAHADCNKRKGSSWRG